MKQPTAIDYGLLTAVGLIWGSQFIFNELAIQSFPALTVAAGRVLIGFLSLTVAVQVLPGEKIPLLKDFRNQPWGLYAAIALVEAIMPCFLIPWGQERIDSSIAAILLATVPIFVLLLAPIFVKEESWSLAATLSVIVGFIGVLILVVPDIKGDVTGDVIGELAVLGGAFCFALGLILMKRLPDVPPLVAMRNIFLVGSLPLVVISLATDAPWTAGIEASSLLALLALGTLCGGLAYAIFFYMIQRTGPTFTSLVGYLVTLFGVLLGIVFMGDSLHTNDIIALVLIIAALSLGRLKKA